MTQTPSADDVLMGSGRPAAKFDQPGTVVGGKIVAPPKTHVEREYSPTKPGQGEPKKFPSGDPIYGVTVDVQTSQRNDADDDGVRRIWIEGKRMKESVRDAVREAGAHRLEAGGELWVKFTGFGEAESGLNPPKLWAAKYSAPSGPASQDEAWGPPAASSPPPQAPPVATQGATPPPAVTPDVPQMPQQGAPPPDNQWGDEPPF